MEKFSKVSSTAIPLPIEHVDTDQIIPARFLKATTREGFGDNLFRDWRYDKDDRPIPGLYAAGNVMGSEDRLMATRGLGYSYGPRPVLEGIDFCAAPGEIVKIRKRETRIP